jgi:gas vesicle protein
MNRGNINKFFKVLLKTASYVMDQSSEQVDSASARVSGLVDRGKEMIRPEGRGLRNAVSFAAGVGVGIGAAILFAPASGAEIRSSIKEKVQAIGRQTKPA